MCEINVGGSYSEPQVDLHTLRKSKSVRLCPAFCYILPDVGLLYLNSSFNSISEWQTRYFKNIRVSMFQFTQFDIKVIIKHLSICEYMSLHIF